MYYYDPNKVTPEHRALAVIWLEKIENALHRQLTAQEKDLLLNGFFAGLQTTTTQ